ncbi:MAG: glycosyltransferase family 2 protein [Chloroflexales bacterium]|nr:glycosyltransferase family 2 protein [Chloroflexales bacterium]
MKLIIQIPVMDEADTIGEVLADLPLAIAGVAQIEVLLIDDGCTDDTVSVARAAARHPLRVVRHTSNKGLATAYQTGIDTALRLGADVIVNTDGDHQYPGSEIPRLVAPIIELRADMVIGDRQVRQIEHFSPLKKALQYVGSAVVRWASDTDVPDTVSGFRALNREYALRTFVTTDFSYTVENLIQAGKRRLTIATVPIRTNYVTRPSRLHRGNWNFIKRQASIIARTYATYEPLKTFSYIAAAFLLPGLALLARALYVFLARRIVPGYVNSNDQALYVGGTLVVLATIVFVVGLLADLVGRSQRLQEEILYRVRAEGIAAEQWRREASARLDRLEHDGLLVGGRGDDGEPAVRE